MEQSIHILLIDDDEVSLFIVKKIIDKTGLPVMVTTKSDGALALNYLAAQLENNAVLPDIILLDINMPLLNGYEFLSAFSELSISKVIDIYVLSVTVFDEDVEMAKSFPAVKGFLSKPLSQEKFSLLLQACTKSDID
jgi:CheY-like chemotaxis protein